MALTLVVARSGHASVESAPQGHGTSSDGGTPP